MAQAELFLSARLRRVWLARAFIRVAAIPYILLRIKPSDATRKRVGRIAAGLVKIETKVDPKVT